MYITDQQVRDDFAMPDFLTACAETYRLLGDESITYGTRTQSVESAGDRSIFTLEMPADWRGRYSATKKIREESILNTGRLGPRSNIIELLDHSRNVTIKIEADYITDMRTGATAAVAVAAAHSSPVKSVAILGTGRVARAIALAVNHLITPKEIAVFSRNERNVSNFISWSKPLIQSSVVPAANLPDCVKCAEVVFAAVPSSTPILDLQYLDCQPTLAVVAGDPRTRQIAPEVLVNYWVAVDDLLQANESGEFKYAHETADYESIKFARLPNSKVATIQDIVSGELSPRELDSPIALYFTGIAAFDLVAAVMIYEKLRKN